MPSIETSCTSEVTCDMHYDLDWSTKLRVTKSCSSAIADDPCFGSFACICDNEYLRIAENMPTIPDSYDGYKSIIDNAVIINVSASAAGNSDSDNVGVIDEDAVDPNPPSSGCTGDCSGGDASPSLSSESLAFSKDPTQVVPREPGIDYEWPDDFSFFWD